MRRAAAFLSLTSAAFAPLACGGHPAGSALPKAGGENDDGAGQLAAASSQITMGGDDGSGGFAPEQRRHDYSAYDEGGGYGGGVYGGGAYGAGAYGGYLYGGYVPYGAMTTPPQVTVTPYTPVGLTDGGAITGTIHWPHAPSAPATLAMPACGDVANPTLSIAHGGVADTVVYLARVDHGRAVPVASRTVQVGGQVERRGCALEPSVQVATPVPAVLTITNGDAGPIGLTVGAPGAGAKVLLDEGAMRLVPLEPGQTRIADDAGALIPAWVIGVSHPYYTLTDGDGRFRIDDIPPGAYQVVAWHAPVVVGVKGGKVIVTGVAEVEREVIVKALTPTTVSIDLPAVAVAK